MWAPVRCELSHGGLPPWCGMACCMHDGAAAKVHYLANAGGPMKYHPRCDLPPGRCAPARLRAQASPCPRPCAATAHPTPSALPPTALNRALTLSCPHTCAYLATLRSTTSTSGPNDAMRSTAACRYACSCSSHASRAPRDPRQGLCNKRVPALGLHAAAESRRHERSPGSVSAHFPLPQHSCCCLTFKEQPTQLHSAAPNRHLPCPPHLA